MTNRAVTLWYRAPELLLGSKQYGQEIDLWALGCVMAEMWIRSPLFKGSSESRQIQEISALLSSLCSELTEVVWPDIKEMPLYNAMALPAGS